MANITSPVGRLVSGNLYSPNTKNAEGKPLTDRDGNPRNEFFFAIAIPKGPEQHWNQTEWGKYIWDAGHVGDAHAGQRQQFAWKITDGDSTVLDAKNKRPCDRDGYPGNWVVRFTGGFAPKIYSTVSTAAPVELLERDAIKLGYYIQVSFNSKFNGSSKQPGVYLNFSMVCLCAFGVQIVNGPDVASAGFGAAPLPVGASRTPAPGAMPPQPSAPASVPPPAPGFRTVPPALPVAPPKRAMTDKAEGASYEDCIKVGWTDDLLVEHGMMTVG
jgi:hypothetical protein